MTIDPATTRGNASAPQVMGMPRRGTKDPGVDSLSKLDTSAEVSERDLTPGERRKAGQLEEPEEDESQ